MKNKRFSNSHVGKHPASGKQQTTKDTCKQIGGRKLSLLAAPPPPV